ncbi:MAG: ATP-binding protein [Acidobacteriota bacterium]|jgi:DNA replication protein DnaC
MNDETVRALKFLRLGGLLAHWDEYLTLARKQNFSHVRLLEYILEQECQIKSENARRLRLQHARIPDPYVMETFPFDRQPKLDRKKMLSLYDGFDFLAKKQNILWMGPTGCGKTGLATSFLIQAIHRGYTGRFILFPELIAELLRSVADHSEQKVIRRYLAYDCLLIDELDYVEVEPVQVGLFFTLMHKRHRKKPTLITSNTGFSEWPSFLKNDRLTAALIDRLTESSYVINMKNCVSLRPKLSQEP